MHTHTHTHTFCLALHPIHVALGGLIIIMIMVSKVGPEVQKCLTKLIPALCLPSGSYY